MRFYADGAALSGDVALAATGNPGEAAASTAVSTLAEGTHTIRADYTPAAGGGFDACSCSLPQVVNAAGSGTVTGCCAAAIPNTLTAVCTAGLAGGGTETIAASLAYQAGGPDAGKWVGGGLSSAPGATGFTLKLRCAGSNFSGWRMEALPNPPFGAEQAVTSGRCSPLELHFGFTLAVPNTLAGATSVSTLGVVVTP